MELPYKVLITANDVKKYGGFDLTKMEQGFMDTKEESIEQFLMEVARSIYYLVLSNRGKKETDQIFADEDVQDIIAEAQLYDAIYFIQEGHVKEMGNPEAEFHNPYTIDCLTMNGIIRRALY